MSPNQQKKYKTFNRMKMHRDICLKKKLQAIHLMKGKHMKNSTSTTKKVNNPIKNEQEA